MHFFVRFVLFAFPVFLAVNTLAQTQGDSGRYAVDYDTAYMADFRHRLNISGVTELKANSIGILAPNNKVLVYLTNLPIPMYGFMLSYRWLNAQFTLPVPALSTTLPDRGTTTSYTVALGLTTRNWYIRNFFEYFKGYYINNPEVIFPGTPSGSYIVLEDMKSRTYYASALYMFNGQRYSHRSLLWQSEIQKKSAGTLFTGGTAGFKVIDSPEDLLPDPILADANRARYILFGLNLGYAYTVVLGNHFNMSLAVIPGLNYSWAAYNTTDNEESVFQDGIGLNAEGRFQLLYAKGNFFAGLNYTAYLVTDYVATDYPIGSAHNYIRANVGYRFRVKPIKFLKPLGLSN